MDIFKLVGSIFVDTDAANDSLQKTDKKASGVGETLGKIGKVAAGVGTAVVAGASAAVGGMVSMADKTAATLDVVDKASQRMNISAESYQELAHAASLSGVEMSTMEKAAKKLEGTDLNMDDAIAQIYALETAEERSALAAELFGEKVAYELSPMLNASGEEFAAMRQEANDLGLVFSQDTVSAGAKLNDALSNVKDAVGALGTSLGTTLIPLVTDAALFITDHLPQIQGLFEQLSPILQNMFEQLLPPLMSLAENTLPVIFDLISALMPVFSEITAAILPIVLGLLQELSPIFVQLAQQLLPVIVNLTTALLPVLQPLIGLLTPILQLAMAFLEPLLSLINVILPPLISLITNMASNVLNRIQNALSTGLQGFQNFRDKMKQIWEDIKDVVKRPINAVLGFINGLISGVVGGVNGIIRALNRFQVNVPRWVTKLTGITTFGFNLGELSAPQIPLLAKGGELEGGAAIVGEDGPELLQTNGQRTRVTPLNDNNNAFTAVEDKLDTLIDLLQQTLKMGIFLDSGAMVGQLAPAMDGALGRLSVRSERRI